MAVLLKPGAIVQNYKITELAGDGSQSNVYLAEREFDFFWLIQIEVPDWEPQVSAVQVDSFDAHGGRWVAFPISGTSVVNLASWVDKLELAFIGWRWANLARELSYGHDKKVVLHETHPLALDRLVFNSSGELIVAQPDRRREDEYPFPAPDSPDSISPASDVFSLGASLKALAGEPLPRGVQKVLERAANPDASKRYRNGGEFAEALALALPNPNREKAPAPPRKLGRWLLYATALLGACILTCVGLAIWAYLNTNFVVPSQIAQIEKPLRVTILKWQVESDCGALAEVRVEADDQIVTSNDGVKYFVITPQVTLTDLGIAPGASVGDFVLTFPLGEFCKAGGALIIGARKELRQGTSTVYFYPGDGEGGDAVLVRLGGMQTRVSSYPRMRLFFSSRGARGVPRPLVGAISLRVLQDGARVEHFVLRRVNPDEEPLVAILVMDTSKSMAGEPLARAQEAAINFIDGLGSKDYVCVYRFATEVKDVQACTTDHKSATSAINKMIAGGNTALYDVLIRVTELHARRTERQAVILLSDGADNNSKATRESALRAIESTNIPVYAIGLGEQALAPEVLQEIAERTGGINYEAPTPEDLVGLYQDLHATLATQYQVDFESIFPERKSGLLQLFVSNGGEEVEIRRAFLVEP